MWSGGSRFEMRWNSSRFAYVPPLMCVGHANGAKVMSPMWGDSYALGNHVTRTSSAGKNRKKCKRKMATIDWSADVKRLRLNSRHLAESFSGCAMFFAFLYFNFNDLFKLPWKSTQKCELRERYTLIRVCLRSDCISHTPLYSVI